MVAGAPGMPTSEPRLALVIADSPTTSGLAGLPAISRADAKLSTGCMVSPIRTYSAADSRVIDDRRVTEGALGANKRQDGAARYRNDGQHTTGNQ